MTYQADRPFTIYFVRHGITEPNFRGFRCGGDLDLPMMDIGCDQAYLLAKQIEKMHLRIGVIIAGSLIRTRQTAAIISGVLGTVPVELDPLMNERRLGQWNNRPISETEDMLKRGVTPPGGESEDQFSARIKLDYPVSLGGYTFYLARRDAGSARLGMLVSRRHAALAVERNRIKRCIREAFRLEREALGALDLLIRPPYGIKASPEMISRLRQLLVSLKP